MPEIVYEDNHLLIAVKQPNQLTQGDATGDDCLLEELKRYIKEKYEKPGEVYLGLVHRLDRPVGGLVAFARTSKAASRLSEQLRSHAMHRDYLAVVQRGESFPESGTLRSWLLKDEASGSVNTAAAGTPGAQEAILHFRRLAVRAGTALVHVQLETGRKHQIRVQLASSGHPIVYDMRYGQGVKGHSIALWGAVLTVTHPTKKEKMILTSMPRGDAYQPYEQEIAAFLAAAREEQA